MSRLQTIDPAVAAGRAKELLDAVQASLGLTPNMTKAMANSSAVLEGYLGLSGPLGKTLTPQLREQIALVVAEENGCGYCLSAHTALAGLAGLSEADLHASREARSENRATDAALKFARAVNAKRGGVSNEDVALVRAAGFSDGEIAEIVGHVALNVFTNYFNKVAEPTIDFPVVEPRLARAA